MKGLETMDLRVQQSCDSALKIAQFLEKHSRVDRVRYPGLESHPQHALAKQQMSGFGTVVTLNVGNNKAETFRFLNGLKLARISNNLGDSKSLVTHPATTTHRTLKPDERERLGITDALIRFSVGLEDPARPDRGSRSGAECGLSYSCGSRGSFGSSLTISPKAQRPSQ